MVPNFVDRSIWGISHTSNFAYIDGGAPAITHTHTRGTMSSDGGHIHSISYRGGNNSSAMTKNTLGFCGVTHNTQNWFTSSSSKDNMYLSNAGSHTHSFTTSNNSDVSSVFGSYTEGIRPTSLGLKVKTRYY